MRIGAIDIAGADALARLQANVEHVEREAGAGHRIGAAAQRHLIAARDSFDAEPLLDDREVLVELAEQFLRQAVVIEGNDDVAAVVVADAAAKSWRAVKGQSPNVPDVRRLRRRSVEASARRSCWCRRR